MANACCRGNIPPYSGYTQDGDIHACPICLRYWVWAEDEAEGGGWIPADHSDGQVPPETGAQPMGQGGTRQSPGTEHIDGTRT